MRAADGRGRGAAGAPRPAAAVAGRLQAAHRGCAGPSGALPQPCQTGSPTCASGINAGGDQVRSQVEAQPAREGREAGGAAEDLIRGLAGFAAGRRGRGRAARRLSQDCSHGIYHTYTSVKATTLFIL